MNREQAKIIYLPDLTEPEPAPEQLTQEERDALWDEIEAAERKREKAMRKLGLLGVERGLEG